MKGKNEPTVESIDFKPLSPLEKQLVLILEEGPMTRDQMVEKTGIPRTTIYDGLKKLMMRNDVKKYPLYLSERRRGRPKIMFQLAE
jgi:predicted ArsR family transcriptional regulator